MTTAAILALLQPQTAREAKASAPFHRFRFVLIGRWADTKVKVEVWTPWRPPLAAISLLQASKTVCFLLFFPEWNRNMIWSRLTIDRAVSWWVDSSTQELPPDVGVPIVLNLVVGSSWQPSGDKRPPAQNSWVSLELLLYLKPWDEFDLNQERCPSPNNEKYR